MVNNESYDIQKNYSDITTDNFVIKTYSKGMSRFLILWIINYYGSIHGYAILKELDKFFAELITDNCIKQSNPSNIYPILNKMEDLGLITSKCEINNNRKIKYYMITSDGAYLLDYFYSKLVAIHKNSQWLSFFEDMGK